MVDLLEDPDGAPYPEEVQEFVREVMPLVRSAEDKGWLPLNGSEVTEQRLVAALESIANHYREQANIKHLSLRLQIARLADSIEHGALRWEEPLSVPGVVEDLDKILAGRNVDDLPPDQCKWHEGERGKKREAAVMYEVGQAISREHLYRMGEQPAEPATEPASDLEVQPEGASEVAGDTLEADLLRTFIKAMEVAMHTAGADYAMIRRTCNALLFGDPDGPPRDPEEKLTLTVVPGDGPPLSMNEVNVQMSRMEALEREVKRAHLPAWWCSWWTVPGEGFELHTPWWVTGYREGPGGEQRSICAAVRAASEEEAWAVIQNAHDNPSVNLDWRFTQPIPSSLEDGGVPAVDQIVDYAPWTTAGGRFPKADWMVWASKDIPEVDYYGKWHRNPDGSCGCPCHVVSPEVAAHEEPCCTHMYEIGRFYPGKDS